MKSEETPTRACCYKEETGSSVVGFILLLAVVAGLCYFAASNYFVMTNNGMKVYPKKALTFQDTYLDVSRMPVTILRFHEEAVTSMIQQGDVQYLPGGDIIVGMVNAGRSLSGAINRIDNDFQVVDSAREVARIGHEKYEALDGKYHLREKADDAEQALKESAEKVNAWLKRQ